MSIFSRFFRLLGFGKKEAPARPDGALAAWIRDSLQSSLTALNGSRAFVHIEKSGISLPASLKTGHILQAYGGTAFPGCTVIAAEEDAHILRDLCGLEKTHEVMEALCAMAMSLAAHKSGSAPIIYGHAFSDAQGLYLPWLSADCMVYKIRIGSAACYYLLDSGLHASLISELANKPDYLETLRQASPEEGKEKPQCLQIDRELEFIAGRLFLPPALKEGHLHIRTRFLHLAAAGSIEKGCVALELSFGEQRYTIWYSFRDLNDAPLNPPLQNFDHIFKTCTRHTLNTLKAYIPGQSLSGIRFQAGSPQDSSKGTSLLSTQLSINGRELNCRVYVPAAFTAFLSNSLYIKEDAVRLQQRPHGGLPLACINQRLLASQLPSFMNQYRGRGMASIPDCGLMPFFECVRLVSRKDLRIIAQNFIVPRFGKTYSRLFLIETANPDGETILLEADWDRAQFESLLPPKLLAEMAQLPPAACPAEDYNTLNEETMKSLYEAVQQDKLILSFRGRYILQNQTGDKLMKEQEAELDTLLHEANPFTAMQSLKAKLRRNIISRCTNTDLCLAMLAAGSWQSFLDSCLSNTRKAELHEDYIMWSQREADTAAKMHSIEQINARIAEENDREASG